MVSREKNKEYILTLNLGLGADPDDYVLEYAVHDIASDKSAVMSFPIVVE